MKKITFWKSFFLLFALIVGSMNVWADDYEKYSGSITEGDYLLVYSNVAMKAAISSDRFEYTTVSPSNDIISNPSANLIWHIAASGDYWTIYNAGVSKYAASTGAKNKGQLLASGTDDMSLWTVTGSSTYEFVNKKNASNNVNKNLRYNSGYGFACYATSTGGALTLYKKKAVVATALEVKTAPTKVNYKVGEKLDLTGLVLDATVGGNHVDVTSGYTATIGGTAVTSKTTALKAIGAQTITFSYGGKTCDQVIHVGTLQSIAVTTEPTKKIYIEKEDFDATGMVVKATFSDEETSPTTWQETIEAEEGGYSVNPSTNLTVGATSVTISYTWNEVNKETAQAITVNAGPKYTVTYNAGAGTCGTASSTEATYQGGVTLPTATISVTGWEFAGWAESVVANTTTLPTLYKAGTVYKPSAATTLHAVYTLSSTGTTYTRLTSLGQINAAKKIAVASQYGSKILTHDASVVSTPTETTGEITVETNQIFTLTGDNTTGYVLTGGNGTLSQASLSTSSSNDQVIDWSGTNNIWIISANTYADNLFALRNSASDKAALEQYNGWKTEYNDNYASRQYTAMKLYAPKTAYNSNPSAIITPAVEFEKDGTTLYLDANDKTYTNTANVTGVSKTVTYTSSNTNIATVDENGIVTAKKIGTVTITASVDAELGVSEAASDTYEIIIKNASNIAGIKAITDASSVVTFAADITDAVVTYVKNNHAYIQDASGAVYVEFTSGSAKDVLSVGNKINGAISGSIKAPSQIDQITALDLTNATVTEDGVVPAALEVDLATIVANKPFYDGKRVAVSNATVTVTLYDDSNSGGKITDDGGTTTMNLYSPDSGIGVLKDAVGDFAGIISLYGGDTPRFNLYEAGWVSLTRNAPTAQPLAFEESAIVLDEATAEYDTFTGQAVEGAVGTVSYSKTDDSNIIESLDAETGAITLSGAYGTATIKATAAAKEVTEGGVTTPYTATNKSYTITVYPRYTSTFSVNGVVTVVRQATHGAEITVPTPAAIIGDYYFMGWKATTAIATPTDEAPAMVTPPTTPTSNVTYYAVYAQERTGGEEEVISSLSLNQTEPTGATSDVNGVTWSWQSVSFGSSGSSGMKGNNNATVTFELPTTAIKAKSISLTCPNQDWGSGAVVVLKAGNSELASLSKGGSYTFTNSDNTAGTYTLSQTTSKNAWINAFALTYTVLGKENYDYRTSLPVVDVTVTATGYLSYCSPYKLDFSETNVKAYTAKVEDNKVVLTKVDVVPAETGIVLYSSEVANAAEPEATTYTIPVTDKDASDVTGNQMVGVLERTQVVWNPSTGVYNYILQQGEFRKATDGYLKPNRAYLSTSYAVPSNAKALTVVFADTATGINTLDNLTNSPFDNDAPMYNLAGQKVGKSYKGIVIQNGKKVVKK